MKIVLIGAGNLSNHLGPILQKNGHEVIEVVGRSEQHCIKLAKRLKCSYSTEPASISGKADVYLVAVPDTEIKNVAAFFPHKKKLIVHTSGSVPLNVFPKQFENTGVLYPLQTFSRNQKLTNKNIPVCIEGNNRKSVLKLKKLGASISNHVTEIDSTQRLWLHLSAVIVNNFSNHLFALAEKITEEHGLDFDLLRPLIAETASKVRNSSPALAQTGPAKRGDTAIIEKHLQLLLKNPKLKSIYALLSDSIEEMHGTKF